MSFVAYFVESMLMNSTSGYMAVISKLEARLCMCRLHASDRVSDIAHSYDGSPIVNASIVQGQPIVYVSANYRYVVVNRPVFL